MGVGMTRLDALVVGNHPPSRNTVARILIEGGLRVIGYADDEAQALKIASRKAPDVITLDVSMPGPGGLEVLPKLRVCLPGAIIVMLTMDSQYEEEARRTGAD